MDLINDRPMHQLLNTIPQSGVLDAIAVRTSRTEPMVSVNEAQIKIGDGIIGDRFHGTANSKRQVTNTSRTFTCDRFVIAFGGSAL